MADRSALVRTFVPFLSICTDLPVLFSSNSGRKAETNP